jgi:hypothetical protein
MNKVNLTPEETSIIKANADNVLARFYSKWKFAFANDKIFFDDATTDLNVPYHHVLKTTGVNVNTLKKFAIIVSANISSGVYTEHYYNVYMSVDVDSINNFKTKDIDPSKLRNDFQAFYRNVIGTELNENEASNLIFSFDHNGDLLRIKMIFTHYENQVGRRVDHSLYRIEDINDLRKHNMVRSGVVNLCNFVFLWEHTSIEDIMNTTDFYDAYKIYVSDIERYHTLLKMEAI